MFGNGIITTGTEIRRQTSGKYLVHSYEALLDGDGSTGYVFVTNDNKTARRVKVIVAGVEKDHVIISQGLENSGSLIISGSAYLTDQSLITIQ